MPVSGVGSSGSYPPVPPSSGTPAYSYVALGQLSDIAGALGAAAAGGVNPTSGATSSANDTLNAELQAVADLAEIHLYLTQTPPDTADALAAANDFLALQKQFPNMDPSIKALYTSVQAYFQMSGDQVVGFQNDKNGKSFSNWWVHGADGKDVDSGFSTAFVAITALLKHNTSFPGITGGEQYPKVLINMCLLFADALTTPYGKTQDFDAGIWGLHNPFGDSTSFSFGTMLPYLIATYAQLMSKGDPSKFNAIMSQMTTLFGDVQGHYQDGVDHTNYDAMITELKTLQSQMASNPSWPPPNVLPQDPPPPAEQYNAMSWSEFMTAIKSGDHLWGAFMLFNKMYTALFSN